MHVTRLHPSQGAPGACDMDGADFDAHIPPVRPVRFTIDNGQFNAAAQKRFLTAHRATPMEAMSNALLDVTVVSYKLRD